MDKRTLLTMVVMVAFFALVSVVYPLIFPPPPKPPQPAQSAQVGAAPQGGADLVSAEEALTQPVELAKDSGQESQAPAAVPARDITVETPEYAAVLTEVGGRLKSLTLKKYRATGHGDKEAEKNQELVGNSNNQAALPLALRIYVNEADFLDLTNLRFTADQENLKAETGPKKLTFTGRTSKGLVLERTFTFTPGSYLISQTVAAKNQSQSSAYAGRLGMTLVAHPFGGRPGRYDTVAGYFNGDLFKAAVGKAPAKLKDLGSPNNPQWLGYMSQYFLTALVLSGQKAGSPDEGGLIMQAATESQQGIMLIASWPLSLNPTNEAAFDFSVYYGPKETSALNEAGHRLSQSVDLGWFGFLAKPLAYLLRMFYNLVGNYGLAIIIVTILIKIALAPLTAKSYKSMKQMQKLAPRMQVLREKYKDDRETLNKEMMQLYRTYKVNPLGGCLPMLLQIPFFIAFYRVLDYALELRGAPFILWIKDLSAPDRLFDFGVTIPFLEPPTGIPVMTLLMAASMIWQQKMTPSMGDPTQAKIMMLMPLFFSIILLNMPAGLVLYWLVNNVLSIVQQKFINRPDPKEDAPPAKAAKPRTAKK
ncbi:MAG: membrane protein insertase YidC [Deltaproteobacteria bacterium]|jgi:YidC/Oxa1 family membrane protein insertase|nr:membrane protein insertase YidC [Deltaproteobacteria bacterium]